MAGYKKNLRNWEVTTGSGKNVHDTQMKKGEAETTKAEGETNSMTQYTVKSTVPGPYGGRDTKS